MGNKWVKIAIPVLAVVLVCIGVCLYIGSARRTEPEGGTVNTYGEQDGSSSEESGVPEQYQAEIVDDFIFNSETGLLEPNPESPRYEMVREAWEKTMREIEERERLAAEEAAAEEAARAAAEQAAAEEAARAAAEAAAAAQAAQEAAQSESSSQSSAQDDDWNDDDDDGHVPPTTHPQINWFGN